MRDKFIHGLAVQLYLHYSKGYFKPWGQLWPDEQAKWIEDASNIKEQMIKCGYMEDEFHA